MIRCQQCGHEYPIGCEQHICMDMYGACIACMIHEPDFVLKDLEAEIKRVNDARAILRKASEK